MKEAVFVPPRPNVPPPKVFAADPRAMQLPATMALANGGAQVSSTKGPDFDVRPPLSATSQTLEESQDYFASRIQDEAVERAIAQLELTVKACRGHATSKLASSPASAVAASLQVSPSPQIASSPDDQERFRSPDSVSSSMSLLAARSLANSIGHRSERSSRAALAAQLLSDERSSTSSPSRAAQLPLYDPRAPPCEPRAETNLAVHLASDERTRLPAWRSSASSPSRAAQLSPCEKATADIGAQLLATDCATSSSSRTSLLPSCERRPAAGFGAQVLCEGGFPADVASLSTRVGMDLSPAEHPLSVGVSEDIDADIEGALQAEALTLRTELRRADARLQAAMAEESAMKLAMRNGEERHRAWLQEKEEAIAKLRKDNGRLERSTQQAASEERRLADVVRAEPERTEQVLMRLQSECHRLEKENQRLESNTAGIKAELSSVRDVVTTRRNCGQPTRSTHPTVQRAKAKQQIGL